MLLEIDSDGMNKLAAKQFIQFLQNEDATMEEKVVTLFKLNMDDVIAHLDDNDKKELAKIVKRLHKCADWYLNRLYKKIVVDDEYANLTKEELIKKLKETDNDNKGE